MVDPIDPPAVACCRQQIETELFSNGAGKEAPHRMRLPTRCPHHCIHGGTCRPTQHRDHPSLFGLRALSWLLDAVAVDAAARGGFVCGNVGLRAVGRTDLRCFDLAPAPLVAPECFNVVLVMGSSWYQRGAIRRTTEAPPRPPGRRGRIPNRTLRPERFTVPLQSPMNASPFWIMLLLSWRQI